LKSFARVTKLSNVGGRADYITDPQRQENIVASSPTVDWKPYQDYEAANRKSGEKNNEGREVMIVLPNEWETLPPAVLSERAQKIAVAAISKDTDMQWAVHLNSAGTKDPKGRTREVDNLHLHVVFSERSKSGEISHYDRDVYHTDDGKVARSKAQRAKDADGNDKPPVHRKGDAKGGFTPKDKGYKEYGWKDGMKSRVKAEMERMGATIEPPDLVHQRHEGKGKDAQKIRAFNDTIREANKQLDIYAAEIVQTPQLNPQHDKHSVRPVLKERLIPRLLAVLKEHLFPILAKIDGQWKIGSSDVAAKAIETMRKSGGAAARPAPIHAARPQSMAERIAQAKVEADKRNAARSAPPEARIDPRALLGEIFAAQSELYEKLKADPPSDGRLTAAQKAAQNRFCGLLRKIAPGDREAVRGALKAAQSKFSEHGGAMGSMAYYKAVIELDRAIEKGLSEPPPGRGYGSRDRGHGER